MTSGALPGGRASRWVLWLLPLGLGAALLLPRLTSHGLRVEEGRRAWTARAMLETGDWTVPRIWGRPYLSKPPLHPWSIAALSLPGGEVTPRTTRLPSVLASLALALALGVLARRRLGTRAALTAALFLVCSPLFVEKGRLGEIEALLSLTSFLSVAGLGLALESPRWRGPALLSGLALGAALLAKGPPALVFFLGAAAGLAWCAPTARSGLMRAGGLALGVGLVLAGLWTAALLLALPPGSTLAHWAGELVGQGKAGRFEYLRERLGYVLATLLGMAPASLVLAATLRRGLLAELAADPRTRLALCATLPAWTFFLFYPGTAARYVFPILPWVCLLGAARLERLWEDERRLGSERRLGWLVRGLAALALAAGLLGLAATFAPLAARGFDPFGLGELRLGRGASAAALAASAAALFALRTWGRAREQLALPALALACAGLLALNQEASDLRRGRRSQAHLAARLDAALPPGVPLHVGLWGEFNLLFLLDRELVHVAEPREVPPGAHLLLPQAAAGRLAPQTPPRFEALLSLEGPRSGPLELLRRADATDD